MTRVTLQLLESNTAHSTVEGQQFDNPPVLSMSCRVCTKLLLLATMPLYQQIKSTQLAKVCPGANQKF